jgi:hypothetical protein
MNTIDEYTKGNYKASKDLSKSILQNSIVIMLNYMKYSVSP